MKWILKYLKGTLSVCIKNDFGKYIHEGFTNYDMLGELCDGNQDCKRLGVVDHKGCIYGFSGGRKRIDLHEAFFK